MSDQAFDIEHCMENDDRRAGCANGVVKVIERMGQLGGIWWWGVYDLSAEEHTVVPEHDLRNLTPPTPPRPEPKRVSLGVWRKDNGWPEAATDSQEPWPKYRESFEEHELTLNCRSWPEHAEVGLHYAFNLHEKVYELMMRSTYPHSGNPMDEFCGTFDSRAKLDLAAERKHREIEGEVQ